MFPFPRTLPLLPSGALSRQTALHVLVRLVSLVEFMKNCHTGEMVFPDLRATFTYWYSCCIFNDDPACGSFSEPLTFVDADDWLSCSWR